MQMLDRWSKCLIAVMLCIVFVWCLMLFVSSCAERISKRTAEWKARRTVSMEIIGESQND